MDAATGSNNNFAAIANSIQLSSMSKPPLIEELFSLPQRRIILTLIVVQLLITCETLVVVGTIEVCTAN